MDGFVSFTLTPPWGDEILILRVQPRGGDPWGCLSALKGTSWGKQIAVVSGESFSHAMHGRIRPLLRELGPEPRFVCKKIPFIEGHCALAQAKACPAQSKQCVPNEETPECYDPPNLDPETAHFVREVVMAWKENRYVVVVEGKEF